VWLPQLPDNNNPDVNKLLPFIIKNGSFNEETIIISHSAGCPLALAVIQNLKIRIKKQFGGRILEENCLLRVLIKL